MARALNIAHRGFTRDFPDNTLEAFQAAIDIGVDGIEFDVHETADEQFVVFHDFEIQGNKIRQLTLAQVAEVRLRDKYKVPTLVETLDLIGNRAMPLIEVKAARSLESLLQLIRTKVKVDNVTIASFNQKLVLKFSELAPEIRRGIITAFPVEDPVALTQPVRADLIMMMLPLTTAELISRIHQNKLLVYAWFCAGLSDVQKALKFDLDGIISDTPDIVIKEQGAKQS
jgi:glycerophosphoryl diester phosphodiesterase